MFRFPIKVFLKIGLTLFCCGASATNLELEGNISRVLESRQFNHHLSTKVSPEAATRFRAWRQLISKSLSLDEQQKIVAVNSFFNSEITYREDLFQWNKPDYWATPFEVLLAGAGDCEDYAIAKYFTLMEMGVPQDKMRLIYGHITSKDQKHVVLGYYQDQPDHTSPFVLDSIGTQQRSLNEIYDLQKENDFIQGYSFNSESLWIVKGITSFKEGSSFERMTEWRRLILKLRQELKAHHKSL